MTYKKLMRYWRIFKIRIAGKYAYLKKVKRWRQRRLILDLQFLSPIFLKNVAEKYGDQNFIFLMEQLGKEPPMMPPPQIAEWKDGEMIIRDAYPNEIGKPFSFTIPKQPNQ